ncbi:MAG: hypothetical protein H7Y03_11065 [Chitinophagaceae bacterium]|nr:hypothetical protein [Chitinophagaceae bacterium]
MLYVGAGGLAAQLFEDIVRSNQQDVVFWSETETSNSFIKERYPIISTDEQVIDYFNNVSRSFVLCVGDTEKRKKVVERFINLGGRPVTYISPFSVISQYGVKVGHGSMILSDVEMEPGVIIGEQCLLNRRSQYGHGCKLGAHCEVGPHALISAEAEIGEGCLVGLKSVILPRVKIGNNVIISAGSVVSRVIPDNAVVSGVPAVIRFYKKK